MPPAQGQSRACAPPRPMAQCPRAAEHPCRKLPCQHPQSHPHAAFPDLPIRGGKSHEPRPIISRGSTADPSKIDRNSQGSQGRRRSQQPRPDLPRRTTANSKILERCSMRNDRVSILPNHLSILPNHLSILPDRFFKLPDHLSILPDRFSKLPDHSSILPDRFSQSL